jgi:DNA-binding TFAR19-related protein (PDSD5 family)
MMRQRMGQVFGNQNPEEFRNLTPEQRRERMEALRPQMEAARTAFEGEMNEKVRAILTPEQAARLRQLGLAAPGHLVAGRSQGGRRD